MYVICTHYVSVLQLYNCFLSCLVFDTKNPLLAHIAKIQDRLIYAISFVILTTWILVISIIIKVSKYRVSHIGMKFINSKKSRTFFKTRSFKQVSIFKKTTNLQIRQTLVYDPLRGQNFQSKIESRETLYIQIDLKVDL